MYYIVRAARKSSGEILHKPECTVSIETGGGMNPINFLKAHCAQQKIKNENPGRKTGNLRNKQFPYDVTLVGHLWYTAAPSLHVQATVPPPMDCNCYYWISPVFGPGFFCVICQFYGLSQFRFSDGGFGIADCGKVALLRQRRFFMGILHRRVERPNVSFPASRSYPASPCGGSSPTV